MFCERKRRIIKTFQTVQFLILISLLFFTSTSVIKKITGLVAQEAFAIIYDI